MSMRADYLIYRDGRAWRSTPSFTQALIWLAQSRGLCRRLRLERITATTTEEITL